MDLDVDLDVDVDEERMNGEQINEKIGKAYTGRNRPCTRPRRGPSPSPEMLFEAFRDRNQAASAA